MYRIFSITLLLSVLISPIFSQGTVETHTRIRAAVDSREYSVAVAELRDLQNGDAKAFGLNNYDYLLARMADEVDDNATAMVNYQAVVARDSILKAYALFHISRIVREAGNLGLERMYLQQLLLMSPNSLIAGAARERLAKSFFESGDYDETVRILTSPNTKRANGQLRSDSVRFIREDTALLAESLARNGNTDKARDIFARLLSEMPNPSQPDDVALTAAKTLDVIEVGAENAGKKVSELNELEHLQRANIFQFNRDFANAKLHFEAIIGRFGSGAIAPDAVFQIGRGYAQQADYAEALRWFERVQEQYPGSPSAKDALLQAAGAYARVAKHKEAITRYQKFIEQYPSDEKLHRAYLNIVDILRDQGDDSDALKWAAKTQGIYKGKVAEATALFAQIRIRINRKEYPEVLKDLEVLAAMPDLGGSTVPGSASTEEVKFLKGFVLEQSMRFGEAIDTYLSIPDGRSEYYGWRATARLKALAVDESAKSFILQRLGVYTGGLKAKDADERRRNAQAVLRLTEAPELQKSAIETLKVAVKTLPMYQGISAFKTLETGRKQILDANSEDLPRTGADELLFLGLYDEAALQLEQVPGKPISNDYAYNLAITYKLGNRADRAVAFVEPLWKKVPADYPIEIIPRDQLQMLYPAPYMGELLKYAVPRKVDPRLLLAIMRQESRFQPDAKSYAAARGLMQFISTTAAKIAGELDRDSFRQDELYYPPTAILFGSQYLADLFKVFPDQSEAVAASYNGGDDNMKRWLARSESNLPDLYVPEIAYSQSKDYVHKVMASYRIYQFIYDENLRAR